MLRPPLTPRGARAGDKSRQISLFGICMVCGLQEISSCYDWEESMNAIKNEKSFDNRCAAPVSRKPRAPRAGEVRKSSSGNGLRLVSLLIMARGAQVSRAAREHFVLFARPLAARFIGRLLRFVASQERRPPKWRLPGALVEGNVTPCHTNVPGCHTCDIARCSHKPIRWNGLDLKLRSKGTHFYEKRFLL